MKLEDITETIIKNHYKKTIFWLKPAGEDFCKGLLREDESYICMKSASMLTRRYPIDCKYLEHNYDYPNLSSCTYNKK